jgi:hypothetical protein
MSKNVAPSRKPYVAPSVQEQGKVAAVTHQVTPTPVQSGLTNNFDEF